MAGLLVSVILIIYTWWALGISQSALNLQQEQFQDAQEKDRIRRGEDAKRDAAEVERNAKILEQTDQQIIALKAQAGALKQTVANAEISQKPLLSLRGYGWYFEGDAEKRLPTALDSFSAKYIVVNNGVRSVILKEVERFEFDSNFQLKSYHLNAAKTLLVNDLTFQPVLQFSVNGQKRQAISGEELMNQDNAYYVFIFKYEDQLHNKEVIENNPAIYKWEKLPVQFKYYFIDKKVLYYPYSICSDAEEKKALAAVKKYRRAKRLTAIHH